MGKRILIVQGHPDASALHFCHALAKAYGEGAAAAGHETRVVDVARLDFPLLRSQADWEGGALPPALAEAQAALAWAEHVVVLFPLWLGDMPALTKAFFEQVLRPKFAFGATDGNPYAHKNLRGRSARVVVTMGMPAIVYRWFYRAHSVKSLERNILGFVGFAPVATTFIGMVGALRPEAAGRWLAKLRKLGERAQ